MEEAIIAKTQQKSPKNHDKTSKNNTGLIATIAVVLIVASFFIGFSAGKKSVGVKEIVKNATDGWTEYANEKYGYSLKYPNDWRLFEDGGNLAIDNDRVNNSIINVRVVPERDLESREPSDAIQTSIPFDKRNYIVFSTATDNEAREVFYTMPMTLILGR